ncbi:MAG: hypothetical protein KBD10_00515 [Candidatus Pacebacteria bacterium]|nr:hypothetical protein [Candidatus Paceibacterota bacterium]
MEKGEATAVAINIPSEVLWGVLLIVIVLFCMISWVLVHHWNYYGIKGNKKIFAKSLYFIGAVTFLVISTLLLGSYDFL